MFGYAKRSLVLPRRILIERGISDLERAPSSPCANGCCCIFFSFNSPRDVGFIRVLVRVFLGGVDSSFLPPFRRNSTAPFFPLLPLPMRRHHVIKARTSLKNDCQANGSFSFKRKSLLKITTVFSRWLLKFAQAGEKQNPFSTVPRGSPPLLELWFG